MGLPMVGKGHQRKTGSQERANRHTGGLSRGVERSSRYRSSPINHQQPIQMQNPAKDVHQHSLGALFCRRIASQGNVHAGCLYPVHEELDSSTMGQSAARRSQDSRSGALAALDGSRRRKQVEDQVRDVCLVLTCSPLGVLQPQSNFFWHVSRQRKQAGTEYGSSRERETTARTACSAGITSQVGSCQPGVSRSTSSLLDRCIGHPSRGGRSIALDGLRFRQCRLQRSPLLLLASRWPTQGDKNRGFCEAITDASGFEKCFGRMEGANPLQHGWRFCVSIPLLERTETAGSQRGVKAEIKPAFAKLGIVGVGWHTFRHTVGSLLADMGEHQLTIRDYLRHSNLSVTNKHPQATSKTKRLAQEKLVDAILPSGSLSASKSTMIQ